MAIADKMQISNVMNEILADSPGADPNIAPSPGASTQNASLIHPLVSAVPVTSEQSLPATCLPPVRQPQHPIMEKITYCNWEDTKLTRHQPSTHPTFALTRVYMALDHKSDEAKESLDSLT